MEPLQSNEHRHGVMGAVLSVYMVSSFALMMTPAVHNLSVVFSDVPYGVVSMLITIPNLISVGISLLLATPLAAKIHYRQILTSGLTCFVVGGTLPFFLSSFMPVLVSRVIFGIGYGIIVSQGNSLAIGLYKGKKLNKVLSLGAVFNNGFSTVSIIVGGIISDINVNYIWLCHSVALFPLIMVILFIPSVNGQEKQEKKKVQQKIPRIAYFMGIEYGLAYMVSKCVMLTLSSVMIEEEIGTAALAGLLIALNRAGATLGGAVFSVVFNRLKVFTIPFCLLVETVMVAICWKSSSAIVLGVCIAVFGIMQFIMHPTIFASLSRKAPEVSGRSSSLIMAILSFGGFLPSVYLSVITSITGEMDFRFAIFLLIFLSAALTIIWFIRGCYLMKQNARERRKR